MTTNSKVVWSEGLFLRPQHFQQQERYFERYVEARSHGLRSHPWGFIELELERDLLSIGKLALRRARGVWPDGTPFAMPDDDPLPLPLDVGIDMRDEIIGLALPLRRAGAIDTDRAERADALARRGVAVENVRDVISGGEGDAAIEVAPLRARLVPLSQPSEGYVNIPAAHVLERRAEGQVVLEDRFIPSVLVARAAPRLLGFLVELQGLLHQRGEALAQRAVATGRAASAEIADFLLLQSINRYEPLITHLASGGSVHPDDAFALMAQIAGDLSTLTTRERRPAPLPAYRHEDLRASFEPLFSVLRAEMTNMPEQSAISIPLVQKKYGISVATVDDKPLFQAAEFVLAARADLAAEELRRLFPMQIKIGPYEKIRDLVTLQLPGIALRALPVAPRQIPYHTGFAYFGLDQSAELWGQLRSSAGIAVHVSGAFPGLAMELWAIRT